ncbi:MAG TPA: cytochrome c biogenesis protein CcdA [Gemmataceae bacterium]|nr:cytochrome c biogenesis protein CcdA [Gemmataceae bacterium]
MKWAYRWLGPMVALLAMAHGSATAVPPVKPPRARFQEAVPRIEAAFEPSTARRGQTIQWKLTVDLAPGWHTYTALQVDDNARSQAARFKFPAPGAVVFVGELTEPPFQTKAEPEANIKEIRYLEHSPLVWERPAVVSSTAPPGPTVVKVGVRLVVCNESGCLPPQDLEFDIPLTISDEPPVPVEDRYTNALKATGPSVPVEPPTKPKETESPPPAPTTKGQETDKKVAATVNAETAEQYRSMMEAIVPLLVNRRTDDGDLWAFILAGIFWGAVSLITPCVFPMIPITVSYFLKQSEKEHHRPLTMAAVYCGTIIVVLAVAAVLLLSLFRWLSINPIMNFGIGLLFVFFALSLFGWYEIELPSGLARFTSAREGQGGLVGTMFMALTFTILSFACVAPFLGGFGGTAAAGRFTLGERLLGGLAFAVTFAAPFFVLALFPSLLKKLPKSGSWLNSVKVVMGFLELAAAFKFFRLGELVLTDRPTVFTYDLVMGIWVALSLLCGLYLLGVYRLPHDSPQEHIGVPRLLFSMAFLGLGFYLLPALFSAGGGEKQRPAGVIYAWVDSFLLPEPSEGKGELAWSGNLQAAIEQARADRRRTGIPKYVFIDFTGES